MQGGRGHFVRYRAIPWDARYGFGAPQRNDAGRKPALQLWHAGTGRLPQGAARDEAGGKNSGGPSSHLLIPPGAYPGKDAEERGQGEAIARNLMEMSGLTVPVLAIVTGEGSSGGALGLGVANHILMLENAVYSVLSPEGFASILWKDASRSGEACTMMKLTAQDLYTDGIVEEIIAEPLGGAQRGRQLLFSRLDTAIAAHLAALCKMSGKALADQRYKKNTAVSEK